MFECSYLCWNREEVQRSDSPHDRTRSREEVQVRGSAVHTHIRRLQGEHARYDTLTWTSTALCVCVLTSMCVLCRLPYQQHALVHQQRVQCELLSASGLLQPQRSACGARGRSRGHHHGCSSGCPGHGTGQNTDTPRPGSSLSLYLVSTLSNSLTAVCKLAAWFWSGPDEGGPQDLQSESQLRGHQEQ